MTIRTIRDGDQAVVVETTADGRVSIQTHSSGGTLGWNAVERLRRALTEAVLEQHLREAQAGAPVPSVDGLAILNALRRHHATVPG